MQNVTQPMYVDFSMLFVFIIIIKNDMSQPNRIASSLCYIYVYEEEERKTKGKVT